MVDVPLYKLELAEWPIHQVIRACRAERESRESRENGQISAGCGLGRDGLGTASRGGPAWGAGLLPSVIAADRPWCSTATERAFMPNPGNRCTGALTEYGKVVMSMPD
jgi:hypothetical protein